MERKCSEITNSQIVRLGNLMIGDGGAEILANALFNNLFIEEIYLEYNNIGINGTKHLCEKVFRKRSLKFLNLKHNNIDNMAAFYLGKYLGEVLICNPFDSTVCCFDAFDLFSVIDIITSFDMNVLVPSELQLHIPIYERTVLVNFSNNIYMKCFYLILN